MKKKGKDEACGVPTRAQKPGDVYGYGGGAKWSSGKLPPGGYRAVIPFNSKGRNDSGTTKPEPKNRIV